MTAWDSMVARGIYRDSTPFKVPFLLQPFFIFLSHAEMLLHRASLFFFCLFLCPVSEHYGMGCEDMEKQWPHRLCLPLVHAHRGADLKCVTRPRVSRPSFNGRENQPACAKPTKWEINPSREPPAPLDSHSFSHWLHNHRRGAGIQRARLLYQAGIHARPRRRAETRGASHHHQHHRCRH